MQSYLFFSFQVGEARAASGHLYARVGGRRRGVDPIFKPCLSEPQSGASNSLAGGRRTLSNYFTFFQLLANLGHATRTRQCDTSGSSSGSPDTETVILYSQLTSFKDRDVFQVLFFPLFFIGGTPGLGGTYIMAVCVAKSVYLHVPYVHAAERLRSHTNNTNSSVYPSFECEAPSRLQSNWV